MGNISNILGGAFTPPAEKFSDPPEIQLRDEMIAHGLIPPDQIVMDGQIHRFNSGTKGKGGHGDKTGWYVMYSGQVPAGVFGDWRSSIEVNFRADIGRQLSAAEEMAHARRISEAKMLRDAELAKSRDRAASTVQQIWEDGTHASSEHGYLQRKKIKPHGARVTGDGRLMVPLFDDQGNISSLQYIGVDGDKKYHPGGATGGMYWSLGDDISTIYIAEGFATAATIYETTNKKTIIAYSASNLVPVTKTIKEQYPHSDICIVADNDASGVGIKYADQASAKYGVRVVMPPEQGDANDYVVNGFDLNALLQPKQDDWLIRADDFSAQPAPISWLVKGWLQDKALIMVHGPSGGGKTFIVLDWCLNIASEKNSWFGNKIKNGSVIYLAGEGHHGLRGRVAAWKQHHQIKSLDMWLSRDGCNLNTHEGYQRVLNNVRSLSIQPSIIVVDTLHRFLEGDENSSQDAKTMLDACNGLMQEFNCSVLLVHHTGVSDEAQHRARGSSAWRGALDIEISVVPSKGDSPIEIVQRKSKDAELKESLYCELLTTPIEGWFDEDGEAVTSAIVSQVEHQVVEKKDSELTESIKLLERAWLFTDAEILNKNPYLSASGFKGFLSENMNFSESKIKNEFNNSNKKGLIFTLKNAEIIQEINHGFMVINPELSSAMLLKNNT